MLPRGVTPHLASVNAYRKEHTRELAASTHFTVIVQMGAKHKFFVHKARTCASKWKRTKHGTPMPWRASASHGHWKKNESSNTKGTPGQILGSSNNSLPWMTALAYALKNEGDKDSANMW